MKATVTAKGQVTLPVEARRRLRIKAGTKLEFLVVGDRLEAIPVAASVTSLKGIVPKPSRALSLNDIDRAVAEGAAS